MSELGPVSTPSSETLDDSPVLSLINKRLRNLRKKFNRIPQMEESLAQGKPLNKEQAELFQSKPILAARIDELENLRNLLASAVSEERSLALQLHATSANKATCQYQDQEKTSEEKEFKKFKGLPTDDSKLDHNESSTMIIADVPSTGSSRPSQIDQHNEGISLPFKELNGTKINWKRRSQNIILENRSLLWRVRKLEEELGAYFLSNVGHLKFCVLNRWYSLQENDSDPDPDPDPLIDQEDDQDSVFDMSIMEGKEAGIIDVNKLEEVDWESAYKIWKKRNWLLKMQMEAFQNDLETHEELARKYPGFTRR